MLTAAFGVETTAAVGLKLTDCATVSVTATLESSSSKDVLLGVLMVSKLLEISTSGKPFTGMSVAVTAAAFGVETTDCGATFSSSFPSSVISSNCSSASNFSSELGIIAFTRPSVFSFKSLSLDLTLFGFKLNSRIKYKAILTKRISQRPTLPITEFRKSIIWKP